MTYTHISPQNSYTKNWVFLPGLMNEFDLKQNNILTSLEQISYNTGVSFVVLEQYARSSELGNRLYWPHANLEETLQTYEYIQEQIKNVDIAGFIGFSNGGYFLARLVQDINIDLPIIIIGAGDKELTDIPIHAPNLHILIGTEDTTHHQHALNLLQHAAECDIEANLVNYEGGHILPVSSLTDILWFN